MPDDPARWLPALADAIAGHVRMHRRDCHFPWDELAHAWLCEDRPAPLQCAEPIQPHVTLELLRALASFSKPLLAAGLLAQARVDHWARTMLASTQLRYSLDPDDPGAEPPPEPVERHRWQPGRARLTHPAFRPVLSWCMAELLRRELLAEALMSIRNTPRERQPGPMLRLDISDSIRYWFDTHNRKVGVEEHSRLIGAREKGSHTMLPGKPLPEAHWLEPLLPKYDYRVDLVAHVDGRNSREVAEIGDALRAWLRSRLLQELRRHGEPDALHRRVWAACPLQAEPLHFAWRLRAPGKSRLSGRDYELAWRDHPALVQMQEESPSLFPILVAVLGCLDDRIHCGYHELKRVLIANGMSDNAWQRLARFGYRTVRPFRDCFNYHHNPITALVRYFNLLVACCYQALPSPELARAVVDHHYRDEDQNEFRTLMFITRAAWNEIDKLPADAVARIVDTEVRPMLHLYAAGHWQPVTLPRAIPWAWFRRQLQLQQRKLALGPLLQTAWSSALDQYAHDNLVAVALTSGAALWEEATAMRHCAGNADYVQECVLGFVRMFSVRDRITGKRRATVSLQRHFGGWRVAQTTGFANRKADDSVIDFTRRLLVAFNAAVNQSGAASDRVTEPEPALERKQEPEPEQKPDQEPPIISRRRSAIGPPAPS